MAESNDHTLTENLKLEIQNSFTDQWYQNNVTKIFSKVEAKQLLEILSHRTFQPETYQIGLSYFIWNTYCTKVNWYTVDEWVARIKERSERSLLDMNRLRVIFSSKSNYDLRSVVRNWKQEDFCQLFQALYFANKRIRSNLAWWLTTEFITTKVTEDFQGIVIRVKDMSLTDIGQDLGTSDGGYGSELSHTITSLESLMIASSEMIQSNVYPDHVNQGLLELKSLIANPSVFSSMWGMMDKKEFYTSLYHKISCLMQFLTERDILPFHDVQRSIESWLR